MDFQTILILALIGLAAGYLSGFVGIGGGIIMVPALTMLLLVDQKTAQGTSLAVLMMPIGILGVYNYYKQGHVEIKYALVIAALFVAGSYFGSKTSLSLDTTLVKRIFGGFMILVALKFIFGK